MSRESFGTVGASPPEVDLARLRGRPVLFAGPRPMSTVFGGLEVQLTSTADALRGLGLDVRMFDAYDRHALDGAALVHVFGSDYPVQQMVSLLAGKGVPVAVSSVYFPTRIGTVLDRVTGGIPRMAARFQRLVLQTASVVLPNSADEARLIRRVHGVEPSRIAVVPNGFAQTRLGGDAERFRRKYLAHAGPERPFVLCVARVEPRKNTLELIRAARQAQALLVLVGAPNPSEGRYAEQVARECEAPPSEVLWIRGVPSDSSDLADAYAAAHVHALPSEFETPGLSSLEAGANGCNLIVGRCAPVEEYFNERALFVAPGRVAELEQALQRALSMPRDGLGQAAHVKGRFSWRAVAQHTAAAYTRILG